MAKRGPKPRPTKIKIALGTRADRVNLREPAGPIGAPAPPTYLDPVARSEWDRMVPGFTAAGVLALVDGAALALYCQHFSRWRAAEEEVTKTGLVRETNLGGLKINPAVAIAQKAQESMLRILAEFGGTPSARSRLSVNSSEPKRDALSEFLAS